MALWKWEICLFARKLPLNKPKNGKYFLSLQEILNLVIHGFLHFSGYDHEKGKKESWKNAQTRK